MSCHAMQTHTKKAICFAIADTRNAQPLSVDEKNIFVIAINYLMKEVKIIKLGH